MKLMIVESPGKTKKLQELLSEIRPSETWRVVASVGHVRDLPSTGQGDGEITTGVRADFTPIYELTERGREVVTRLQRDVARADEVYLATDPDREGESISWHLKDALGLKNPIRIAFGEITEAKVREALAAPRRIDMRRVSAQEARRVVDRLVGYLVSPELKRQTGVKLSAGRVQSVAVYVVAVREREIKNFKVTNHFGVRLTFAGAKIGEQWCAEWLTGEGFTTSDNPYFMDRGFAEKVAQVRQVMVLSYDESPASRNPPAPFKTTTLQKAASNALGFDPDETMKIAQNLYEKGHISYHRTDNPNVSEEAMPDIRAVAKKLGLEVVEKRRNFSAGDDAQEGHPGITPTHWDVESAGDNDAEKALYKLIRIRAIASQLLAARYKVSTVVLETLEPVDGKLLRFGAKGRTLIDPGWLQLLSTDTADDADEDETETVNSIPTLADGERVFASTGELQEKKTKAPSRFTKASLIGALEAAGIGRPSTYAAIWANICAREYVGMADKRFIKMLPTGDLLVSRLEDEWGFMDMGFTRGMESELDGVATGSKTFKEVIEKMYVSLAADLQRQQSAVPTKAPEVFPCPDCNKPLRYVAKGAHGPFWGCTGYPDCSTSLPDVRGKPGARKKVELTNFLCEKCSKPLVHRQKKGKGGYDFWGCSGFSDGCKESYKNVKGAPDYSSAK
ncbi:type I DNA topoisomerase [Cellvibrio sp. OA-2007]|uniref:type I DNA topoisomerase n=1 Tax=Cellvibrio sp. OA-2007 TaxID=529823 RepID=UPI0007863548|nr:type I DNA topoisomerase [Cellvibrio sp. OA-2007]